MNSGFISFEDCKNCEHFEKAKKVNDRPDVKGMIIAKTNYVIMCKYPLNANKKPFSVVLTPQYKKYKDLLVQCVKLKEEQSHG